MSDAPLSPCPCCGHLAPRIAENGVVSCPAYFDDIEAACPMFAEDAARWEAMARWLPIQRAAAGNGWPGQQWVDVSDSSTPGRTMLVSTSAFEWAEDDGLI